jgi:hypothetical protein
VTYLRAKDHYLSRCSMVMENNLIGDLYRG